MFFDKDELYIYFTLLYLVFVSCSSPFCELLQGIFILYVILEQKDQREDKIRPNELKMENDNEHAAAWPYTIQKPESNMSWHDPFVPRHAMAV